PLHVDPTGRYLVDQNGTPFLITGDSPQALIGNLTESDAALFFSTRRAQGFNTVWINLLCNNYTGCRQDGETWDGIPPFTTPGDLSTPNEAYFSRVDRMIQLAAQYGFVVLLDPAETGGWLDTLIANGVDKDRAYGQYLGRRYGGFSNIIWMSGNDYQTWGPDNDPYVTAVAQGIRDTDPSALQTVELNYLTSGSLNDPAWAPLIDLNASYIYDPTYVQLLKDYNRSNFLPTFLVEGPYEDEQNTSSVPAGTPQQLRRQEYWSLLSGATGQLFGNHHTWQFLCSQRDADGNCVGGWKDQLASPGATQMANVVALLSSRPWYELVPDQDHTVVTSGYGSFGGDDYVTAARTPDGKLAMAYVPSARTIKVDLGKLSGPVTARWYDPTNGTFTAIGGGPLANNGSVSLATPGANADGADDWVLVLEAS
ncbi:MAG: glycoside hydrolase family 140 protein, partial [Solirubrobacteraceae bacterium]